MRIFCTYRTITCDIKEEVTASDKSEKAVIPELDTGYFFLKQQNNGRKHKYRKVDQSEMRKNIVNSCSV